MTIHEECGVFGVYSLKKKNVAKTVYYGLYQLQHRGQESCGIVVNDDGVFSSQKDLGLVGEVFNEDVLSQLSEGNMAIGHVRYGTTGKNVRSNCQPLEINHQRGKIALAHNGNLSNALTLRDQLELSGAIFHTTSDTETIAYMITRERLKSTSIEQAIIQAMEHLKGAYSLVLMSSTKMIAVRDPFGFRPLCFGKTKDGDYIVASESAALASVNAEFIRDVLPGEVLVFNQDGIKSIQTHCHQVKRRNCIFEYIYFSRPDSVIDEVSVSESRKKAGEILAESHPVDADLVIGVPDSGLEAALGYAKRSKIPYEIGLIKNKYIGRTFISPGPEDRINQVKIKLSPIKEVVEGKRIVLVDDSIVRGTTSKIITSILREAGAKEIHMRISAPPFLHPCYYGTDIDSEDNLIAAHLNNKEIAKKIGVDSLGYLNVESLHQLVGHDEICTACFTGDYPTEIPLDSRKDRFERKLSEKE